ncbi:MAG: prepilin-type N-terminal cleavage/methylation domain-containing protein, partial [Planctomycetes bacterium]|nr:prepilin-type N-terminal cleavage/methylation domain-containing protein [Planctomycetota bacterium]
MFNKSTADRFDFYGARSREFHQHERADGFTLIEILIATSVLTLGLVGILALFPVAIKAGRTVVEASNSVVIAQSVVDAIRSGIRNSKGLSKQQGHAYFILRHDGVTDKVPSDSKLHDVKDDYYIILPRFQSGRKFPGARGRVASLRRGKLF